MSELLAARAWRNAALPTYTGKIVVGWVPTDWQNLPHTDVAPFEATVHGHDAVPLPKNPLRLLVERRSVHEAQDHTTILIPLKFSDKTLGYLGADGELYSDTTEITQDNYACDSQQLESYSRMPDAYLASPLGLAHAPQRPVFRVVDLILQGINFELQNASKTA